MPMLIFQVIYYIILAFAFIAGIFIVYHIIRYSYSKTAMILMLLIFCCVFVIMVSANYALFLNINEEDVSSLLIF
jgi:uncharacterized membrane protein YoaK (UPF0700 family)